MSGETIMSGEEKVLGLDIGAGSMGWSLTVEKDGQPQKALDIGVRVFKTTIEDGIESGKEVSPAVPRREARLRRRQLYRRAMRLKKLAATLQKAGLLPPGDISSAEDRKKYFDALDASFSLPIKDPATFPYYFRKKALDEKLEPFRTGRAIYHLAQRRGYLSNRKAEEEEDDEIGKVRKAISELEQNMEAAASRTLGEYLSTLNPRQERIRSRYLSRKMVDHEFEAIWNAQKVHHPEIFSDENYREIYKTIFFQRPIQSAKGLVGKCELDKKRRAPASIPEAQRFRLVQKVNDLKITGPDGLFRPLTPQERSVILDLMDVKETATFGVLRKAIGEKGKFNLELDGDSKFFGNKTNARMVKIFGEERWFSFSDEDRERIINDVRSVHKVAVLKSIGETRWNLSPEAADLFSRTALEEGYSSLSRSALKKLLPLMEDGVPYGTAVKQLYGVAPGGKVVDELPPLFMAGFPMITNPAVKRALTEMRKVVNAVVAKHGKPDVIRVELARDLKKNKKDRARIFSNNNANKKRREKARAELLAESTFKTGWEPRGSDIEKWLLREECGGICPYTGRPISFQSLFVEPEFDVEHIVPFSRCFDNSYLNKTLCYGEENRTGKRNRTPWEAYGSTDRWDEILGRVKNFRGDARRQKLDKFMMKEIDSLEDFTSRQLNDTRYASKLACRYLGMLYGAGITGVDPSGRKRIQVLQGGITAKVRDALDMNSILGDGGGKTREDHRHHAVDAVAIAITNPGMVNMLNRAAASAESQNRRWFDRAEINEPWPFFRMEVGDAIRGVTVSHRPRRKVAGALHEETVYSKVYKHDGKEYVHVRKKVEALSPKDVENIVDPAVREVVEKALSGGDPKKVFADRKDHPKIPSRSGEKIPVHTVRVRVSANIVGVGSGASLRNVVPGSNHHVEIFEVEKKNGKTAWEGRVVSTLEAFRRLNAKEAVVSRQHDSGGKFLFSLCGGDVIEADMGEGKELFVVRTLDGGNMRLSFVRISDARMKKDILKDKQFFTKGFNALQDVDCRKVEISPIGEVYPCNE